ncbi:MAG: DUF1861 family protein [Candidatus Nanopelagicales bacterium]
MPPLTAAELLSAHRNAGLAPESRRLNFRGVDGMDVYNITVPFPNPADPAQLLIGGRVEHRASEQSQIRFFAEVTTDVWALVPGLPSFDLQDPFVANLGGVLHLGGVEVTPDASGRLSFRTLLLRCPTLDSAEIVFTGPWGMKDIRFVELESGRIGVFTRPRLGADGPGRVGFTVVAALDELTDEVLQAAPRLSDLFAADEWGGVNHATLLHDGRLAVVGHVARFDERGDRHYYPVSFTLNPADASWSGLRILFERRNLAPGASKRPDLSDVIFPGGWVVRESGKLTLYCGAGDAEAHTVSIPTPFRGTLGGPDQ